MSSHPPPAPTLAPYDPTHDLPTPPHMAPYRSPPSLAPLWISVEPTPASALAESVAALDTCHATVTTYQTLTAPLKRALRDTAADQITAPQLHAFVALTADLDVPSAAAAFRARHHDLRHRLAIAALRVGAAAVVLRKLGRAVAALVGLVGEVVAWDEGVGAHVFVGERADVEYVVARFARRMADVGRECETHCAEMRAGSFLDVPNDVADDDELVAVLRDTNLEQTTFWSMAADELMGATVPREREVWLKRLLQMDKRFRKGREGWEGWETVRKEVEEEPIALDISSYDEEWPPLPQSRQGY